jgi:hypothetical protein
MDMQLARAFRSSPATLRMKLRSRHSRDASIHNIKKPVGPRRRVFLERKRRLDETMQRFVNEPGIAF